MFAVRAIRNAFDADRPGIYEAMDIVVGRYEAIGRPLFTPTEPLDVGTLFAAVQALPVRPDAVEAVWDGDTDGWFVVLFAVTKDPQREFFLAQSRRGTDLRFFNERTPAWPEAEEADTVGRALAERLGVPFSFASPQTPDGDAPRWWDGRW